MRALEALPAVPMYENTFAHFLIGFIIWAISERVGKLLQTYHSEYQEITSFWQVENSVGFNAVYRILFAPLAIVGISIFFYAVNWLWPVANIWTAAIWFAVIQATAIILLARWRLVNKAKFIVFHIISIALSYYLYVTLISKGIASLLPDETNLRTELWLVVALFFYGVFRSIKENEGRFRRRKRDYMDKRAAKFRKKYASVLEPYDLNFRDALVAVMIYEDYNRPKAARIVEDLTGARTRGIMQVAGATTDEESIRKAADIMLPGWLTYQAIPADTPGKESQIYNMFMLHNPDGYEYASRVRDIYVRIAH